jgi:heme/copper-type cytochrome/quinol oxidase subunit 2
LEGAGHAFLLKPPYADSSDAKVAIVNVPLLAIEAALVMVAVACWTFASALAPRREASKPPKENRTSKRIGVLILCFLGALLILFVSAWISSSKL